MAKIYKNTYYKLDTKKDKILIKKYLEFLSFKFLISSHKITGGGAYYPQDGVGIGNRLKNIISCIKAKKGHLNIHWADKGWVSAKFSDLFIFENYTIIEDNDIKNYNNEPDFYKIFRASLYVNKKDNVPINFTKKILPLTYKKYSIDFMYQDIPENVRNVFRPYFSNLKPSKKVAERMNDFKCDSEYVALQVRNNPDWDNHFKNSDLEKYFDVIDNYPKETVFYLSSMNKETSEIFKNRYKERILELPNKNYSSMVDATADLFLMAKGKEMIVSFASTFSECAWWLGGAMQNVVVIGSYNDFLEKGANAVKSHKMESKRKGHEDWSYMIKSKELKLNLRKIFDVHNEIINGKKQKVVTIFNKKYYR